MLRKRLVELHEKYPALGLDSLYHLLKLEIPCTRKRVHRQMCLLGIHSARHRAYKITTNSNHSNPTAPNLLQRKDLCTRKIVGYAFSSRIDTQLALSALNMAVRRQKPGQGLIFHSDCGVQYAAQAFRERLETYGIRQSMSRKGDPYAGYLNE